MKYKAPIIYKHELRIILAKFHENYFSERPCGICDSAHVLGREKSQAIFDLVYDTFVDFPLNNPFYIWPDPKRTPLLLRTELDSAYTERVNAIGFLIAMAKEYKS